MPGSHPIPHPTGMMQEPGPLPSQRSLFDVPRDIAYFNCAYSAPQLNLTRERLIASAARKSHPWERMPADFFADAESIRSVAAAALGGDREGYAIVPGASYGVSAAARAIQPRLARRNRILVLEEEFPSNYYPWHRVAVETGAIVDTVMRPRGGDWTRAILGKLDRDVRVVAAPNCHWTDGSRIDLLAVSRACRELGAALVVDATQSLGAMPLSVSELKPAFMVAAGYKWLLCPYGVGLLYVGEEWRDSQPLEETWLARDGAENFAGLTKYSDTYLPGARRFDVSEKCTAQLPGALAALEQIGAWTIERIAASLGEINRQIADFLAALDFQLSPANTRCPHIVGVRLPSSYRGDFVGALRARNVFISQRGSTLRFSPHLHIDEDDLAHLFQSVEDVLRESVSLA